MPSNVAADVTDEAKNRLEYRATTARKALDRRTLHSPTQLDQTRSARLTRRACGITALCALTSGLLLALRFHSSADLSAYLMLALVGAPLSAIDFAVHRLPNWLTYPSYPLVGGTLWYASATEGSYRPLLRAAEGTALLLVAFLALAIFAGMGLGDVKLSGLLGMWLGYLGWGYVARGIVAGWALAAVWTLVKMALGGAIHRVPMGPFLLSGTLLAVLL